MAKARYLVQIEIENCYDPAKPVILQLGLIHWEYLPFTSI